MVNPGFPAARGVASRVATHLARHMADAHARGVHDQAVLPSVEDIETVIETAFWASLRHEEGFSPKISLAMVGPAMVEQPLLFEQPLDFTPAALSRLAPAVERPGIHLGVWRTSEQNAVWGTTRDIPVFCLVIEVVGPGVLVFKHRHLDDSAKFVNMAVLDGDEVKFVDERVASPPDCPELVASLLGFELRTSWRDAGNVLVQLAVSMRAHKRGGLLLMVPDDNNWLDSLVRPISYAISPPYTALADVMRRTAEEHDHPSWRDALMLEVEHIAGLTAVDGATVLTNDYAVLAFGAKIMRRYKSPQVDQVIITEPIQGREPVVRHTSQLGGTRHLSAAQFVHDQRDAVALVASQDGSFTVFQWSAHENMVHGHRVESLLL